MIIPAGATIFATYRADIVSMFIGVKDVTFWRFGLVLCVLYFIVLGAIKYKAWLENKFSEIRHDLNGAMEAEGKAWRCSDSTIREELRGLKNR